MKMIMAVVPSNTAERVLDALINAGYTATYAETHGGMLQQSQHSLFIAVKKEQTNEILGIIRDHCRTRVELNPADKKEQLSLGRSPVTAELGGAVVFIWELDQIETL